jgi:hypothetical protein
MPEQRAIEIGCYNLRMDIALAADGVVLPSCAATCSIARVTLRFTAASVSETLARAERQGSRHRSGPGPKVLCASPRAQSRDARTLLRVFRADLRYADLHQVQASSSRDTPPEAAAPGGLVA